jgi:hypothetical protein
MLALQLPPLHWLIQNNVWNSKFFRRFIELYALCKAQVYGRWLLGSRVRIMLRAWMFVSSAYITLFGNY